MDSEKLWWIPAVPSERRLEMARGSAIRYLIKEIAWHLMDYWNALYRLYPECINSPSDFSMMKMSGLPALNRLFTVIYTHAAK
jgi:hypothetical protein